MNKNKIILGALTTIIGVAAPISTVVSCGKNTKEDKIINLDINIDNVFTDVQEKMKNNTKKYGELKESNDKVYVNPMEVFGEEVISQLFKSLGKTSNVAKAINDKLNQKNEKNETFLSLICKEISGIFKKEIIPYKSNRTITKLIKEDLINAISDWKKQIEDYNNGVKLQKEKSILEKKLLKITKDEEKSKINKKIDDLKEKLAQGKSKDIMSIMGAGAESLIHVFKFSIITLMENLLNSFLNSKVLKLIDKAQIKPKDILDLVSNLNNSTIKVNINYKNKNHSLTSNKLSINKRPLISAEQLLKKSNNLTMRGAATIGIAWTNHELDKGDKDAGFLQVLLFKKTIWKTDVKKTSYFNENSMKNIQKKLMPWIRSTGIDTIKSFAESIVHILENKPFLESEVKLQNNNLKELREQFKLLEIDSALFIIDMMEDLISLYIP